jgi:hypothetical protein
VLSYRAWRSHLVTCTRRCRWRLLVASKKVGASKDEVMVARGGMGAPRKTCVQSKQWAQWRCNAARFTYFHIGHHPAHPLELILALQVEVLHSIGVSDLARLECKQLHRQLVIQRPSLLPHRDAHVLRHPRLHSNGGLPPFGKSSCFFRYFGVSRPLEVFMVGDSSRPSGAREASSDRFTQSTLPYCSSRQVLTVGLGRRFS